MHLLLFPGNYILVRFSNNILAFCLKHPIFSLNREQWESILANNSLDEVEIRDNRYNQV